MAHVQVFRLQCFLKLIFWKFLIGSVIRKIRVNGLIFFAGIFFGKYLFSFCSIIKSSKNTLFNKTPLGIHTGSVTQWHFSSSSDRNIKYLLLSGWSSSLLLVSYGTKLFEVPILFKLTLVASGLDRLETLVDTTELGETSPQVSTLKSTVPVELSASLVRWLWYELCPATCNKSVKQVWIQMIKCVLK